MVDFSGPTGSLISNIICPNQDPVKYQQISTKPIQTASSITSKVFILNAFDKCPHPLERKMIKISSIGTNPYLYNDEKKKPILGPNGIPLGSNGGIALNLAKLYNFKLNFTAADKPPVFNRTTGKWTSFVQDVSYLI